MNRFLKIRISNEDAALDEIAERARSWPLTRDAECGFEIQSVTRQKLILSWFEKVIVERLIEGGPFDGMSFNEIRIITFSCIINRNAECLILIDPPLGKERVHKVLRLLFKKANFVFLQLDVNATCSGVVSNSNGRVTAVETEPIATSDGIMVAMRISGTGDVHGYLATATPRREYEFRSACIEVPIKGGRVVEAVLARSGLVRTADETSYAELEHLAECLTFR